MYVFIYVFIKKYINKKFDILLVQHITLTKYHAADSSCRAV